MHHRVILLLTLLLMSAYIADSTSWDYGKHGPDVWREIDETCARQSQSPINIRTACTVYQKFEAFHLSSLHSTQLNFKLQNNGHTIKAEVYGSLPSLTGGNLDGTFYFDSFHLHWGPNHNTGSEHQVNGDKAAGESHFVYTNMQTNQSAVLSFLMESKVQASYGANITNNLRDVRATTSEWIKYFNAAQQLTHTDDSVTIRLTLTSLMGSNLVEFWRYHGSLTTPPCTENVIWTIFKGRIEIPDYEFETFRDDLFFESYRGPQPLYDRNVYRSFTDETLSPIPDQNCCPIKSLTAGSIFIDTNNTFAVFYSVIIYLVHRLLCCF